MDEPTRISRRSLLWLTAVATTAAACGDAGDDAGPPEATVPAPSPTMASPSSKLTGDLEILLWSHFVPSHDKWFDPFAKNWGKEVGVNVTVDHINNTEIVARTAAEIQAKQGHDLIQYIAPLLQFSLGVFVFHEPVPAARWAGFALVWVALAVFTVDALGQRRADLRTPPRVASVGPVEIDTQTRA